jgi:uncharacterized membrane protein
MANLKDTKLGCIGKSIFYLLLIGYIVLLVWYTYFAQFGIQSTIIDLRVLRDINETMYSFGMMQMIFALIGLYAFSMFFYKVVESLFYPKSDKEIRLDNEIKRIKNTYPSRIARIKKREARALFRLEEIKDELNTAERR